MNEISILNSFIIDQFNSNELVNTISIVPTIEVDNNKENIYPLVNIDMGVVDNSEPNINVVTFEITVVQQRDKRPVKTDSKLLDDTNYIDNMNETHSICRRFINVLQSQNNTENIELESISDLKPLKNWSKSGLDGYQFTVDLSIQNKGLSC